jgi:hypothetical protein
VTKFSESKLGHLAQQTPVSFQRQWTDYLSWYRSRKGDLAVAAEHHPVLSLHFLVKAAEAQRGYRTGWRRRRQKCFLFSQLPRLSQQGVGGGRTRRGHCSRLLSLQWTSLTHRDCFNPKWVRLSPAQRSHLKPDKAQGLEILQTPGSYKPKGIWTAKSSFSSEA